MLLKNVKIITMAGADIENGFVLAENGIFTRVGSMNDMPDYNGGIIDCGGMTLYPGFIDAHCHLGMWSDSLTFEGEDGNEDTDPSAPHLRALDSINAMDRCFEDAYTAGVTAVCTGVGSANPIGGSLELISTYGGKSVDRLVIASPAAIKFALGENPKNTYHSRDEGPVTRMATAAVIREQLAKALRYKADKAEYERSKGTDDEVSEPDYDIKCEALLPLFDEKKKLKAHFHCHRADDIFTAIRIAKEFDLDYVLIHCTDGGVIADELASENPAVVLGPVLGDRGKPELRNHDIATPAVLAAHGMSFAVCTDHPETPIQYLPLTAALAVRGGLSREQALRSITIDAARTLGVENMMGSIEEGKRADCALFGGDPLDVTVTPRLVMVNGAIAVNKLSAE